MHISVQIALRDENSFECSVAIAMDILAIDGTANFISRSAFSLQTVVSFGSTAVAPRHRIHILTELFLVKL